VLSRLRESIRQSFVVTPLVGLILGLLLALVTTDIDSHLSHELAQANDELVQSLGRPNATVIAAVGPAMLTFLGVVFSITLVALQMAAGQLSPRVVRLFIRSRVIKCTLAVFIGTFVYTLFVQFLAYEDITESGKPAPFVPLVSGATTMVLVLGSVVMFVIYVHHTVRLMRLSEVIDLITVETQQSISVLTNLRRPVDASYPTTAAQVVRYMGRPGVLRSVNVAWLVHQAKRHNATLRLLPRVGDFLAPGTPVFEQHGDRSPSARALARSLKVGSERSMYQDVSFGLRQLVDIAIRALSPAVNDPTTAVQSLDRIHVLLTSMSDLPLGERRHADRSGTVRLIEPLPEWADLVTLGFTEIMLCGVTAPQVTRRMAAALEDLVAAVPERRRASVQRCHRHLTEAVASAVADVEMRVFALTPDRQGIG